eukprot:m.49169 g.49169  ORF g.49169 m.49169 type:complete len:191 (+) comp10601_c0_seq1:361-933(+)
MVELTEDMVLKAARVSDLTEAINLNFLGMDLEDLSILSRMPAVEVLSLSINKINTLKYFKKTKKIRELYLRRNEISDLSELGFLMGLPDLKVLWLSHNPAAKHEKYRETVLRTLPGLLKLDDKDVTAEELERAKSEGIEIQERDWADEEDGDLDSLSSKAALTAIQALIPLLTPKHLELVALQISGASIS